MRCGRDDCKRKTTGKREEDVESIRRKRRGEGKEKGSNRKYVTAMSNNSFTPLFLFSLSPSRIILSPSNPFFYPSSFHLFALNPALSHHPCFSVAPPPSLHHPCISTSITPFARFCFITPSLFHSSTSLHASVTPPVTSSLPLPSVPHSIIQCRLHLLFYPSLHLSFNIPYLFLHQALCSAHPSVKLG